MLISFLSFSRLKVIGFTLIYLCLGSYEAASTSPASPPRKVVKILSIDGGGIRGIIPAFILKHIEAQLSPGRQIADCFDIIAGTSTGGLIALMLVTPNEKKRPKYKAAEIFQMYEELGKDVFSQSLWQQIKSGNGWWAPKYSAESLQNYLESYLGNVCLKDALTNVIIPAYEIELDKTFFFKSSRAKNEPRHDCFLKDLARATSAAPTYFSPAILIDGSGERELTLVDGGIGVNNPSLAAAVYGLEIFGKDVDFFIVSIGTGTNRGSSTKNISRKDVQHAGMIGWFSKILSTMMHASDDIINYEMYYVFNHNHTTIRHFRLQPILDSKHVYLDKADLDTIKELKGYAEKMIKDKQEDINIIVKTLNQES